MKINTLLGSMTSAYLALAFTSRDWAETARILMDVELWLFHSRSPLSPDGELRDLIDLAWENLEDTCTGRSRAPWAIKLDAANRIIGI